MAPVDRATHKDKADPAGKAVVHPVDKVVAHQAGKVAPVDKVVGHHEIQADRTSNSCFIDCVRSISRNSSRFRFINPTRGHVFSIAMRLTCLRVGSFE